MDPSIKAMLREQGIDIPQSCSDSSASQIQCCCGSPDCAFLKNGNTVLDGLQRDVRAAATVGQALLVRHQTYAAYAEEEIARGKTAVERLEASNADLEQSNTHFLSENKRLVNTVETLNAAITESDTHIHELTATVRSTQYEVQKFSGLQTRTQQLEAQLLSIETEQAILKSQLIRSTEDERVANRKWRESERKVIALQAQLEDIEAEARQESLRHAEVVERMAKRRAVELELDAEKGHSLGHEKRGSKVVSSFVKQILQDNANMQLSVVELQEMLADSQEEVQSLKIRVEDFQDQSMAPLTSPNLGVELGLDSDPPQPYNQELHVHHHYHPPAKKANAASKSRSQLSQKTRTRIPPLTSGRSTPVQSASRNLSGSRHRYMSSSASSTSGVGTSSRSQRTSDGMGHVRQDSFATSSVPGSPKSASYAPSTVFERAYQDDITEYSRPTSPESNAVWSPPSLKPIHSKDTSIDSTFQSFSLPSRSWVFPTQPATKQNLLRDTIAEKEYKDVIENLHNDARSETPRTEEAVQRPAFDPRPQLRRTASNSSLLSISGMDIHTSIPTPRKSNIVRLNLPALAMPRSLAAVSSATMTTAGRYDLSSSRTSGRTNSSTAGAWRILRGKLAVAPDTTPTNNTKSAKSKEPEKGYTPFSDTFGSWLPRIPGINNSTSSNVAATSASITPKASRTTLSSGQPATTTPAERNPIVDQDETSSITTTTTTSTSTSITTKDSTSTTSKQDRTMLVDVHRAPTPVVVAATPRPRPKPSSNNASTAAAPLLFRAPGINQAGGIPLYLAGSRPPPTVLVTKAVDPAALEESLASGGGLDVLVTRKVDEEALAEGLRVGLVEGTDAIDSVGAAAAATRALGPGVALRGGRGSEGSVHAATGTEMG